MVTADGTVKILDFGLAKLAGSEGVTQTGTTVGTVAYMSPEQARGEEVDHRTDIWSLGVVLYETLSGRQPFQGDNLLAISKAILESPTPTLTGAAAALNGVVGRALSKSESGRYQAVTELLDELRGATTPRSQSTSTSKDDVPSIAVLPFANMSADPEQEYFCDGLAEELIDTLARLKGLRVVARTSAFQFRGKGHDLRQVGGQLRVRTILEGSVRKVGSRIRINVQLINVADGYHLWSERYDRELVDVFAVQDEIARAVVDTLRVKLLSNTDEPLVKRSTESLEAHACYLQGRHHRFSRYDVLRAMQCFEEAVQYDPAYAAAWAGVADSAAAAGVMLLGAPGRGRDRATSAVARALSLDDELSDAHAALARSRQWFDWNWTDAEREYKRAIELSPTNVDAYSSYGTMLGFTGRTDEAVANFGKALELDPLSAHAHCQAGNVLLFARRYADAIAAFTRALDLEPASTVALSFFGQTCQACGRHAEAVTYLSRLSADAGRQVFQRGILGHALALAGQTDEARQILVDLGDRSAREYVAPWARALIHLGLRELDEALRYLVEAEEERSPALVFLVLPAWDVVRDHPRVQQILGHLNLPARS